MPYLIRIGCLGNPLAPPQPLPPVKQVIPAQDSVDSGRSQIDHIFVDHHLGKPAITLTGVSLGISYSLLLPPQAGQLKETWATYHTVHEATLLFPLQPVIIDGAS